MQDTAATEEETVLTLQRVDVACALIFDSSLHKVLMVNNKNGESSYWSLPGGAVEVGETLEQALLREAKEETGLEIENKGLYSVREGLFEERGHHALIFTFLSTIVGGELMIRDPDEEILEVKWMDIDEANKCMPYLTGLLKIRPGEQKVSPYYYHGPVRIL